MKPCAICRLVAVAAASVVLAGCSTDDPTDTPASAWQAPLDYLPGLRGEYFEIESKITGRSFHIYVRVPEDYGVATDTRYPVVYLLDGDSLFPILATNHLFLHYDDGIPDALVVGIAYGSFDPAINRRDFDFSAPARDAQPGEGGAPAFHAFLTSELIPAVESRYRADPERRVLFGQSRGGYMVLYSAFAHPDAFWGRIASNPSLRPGRERYFSPAAPARRDDLKLVVTSGSDDRPTTRQGALDWFQAWADRDDAAWAIKTATIEGGTHAADSTNSYRIGMRWLFDQQAGATCADRTCGNVGQ